MRRSSGRETAQQERSAAALDFGLACARRWTPAARCDSCSARSRPRHDTWVGRAEYRSSIPGRYLPSRRGQPRAPRGRRCVPMVRWLPGMCAWPRGRVSAPSTPSLSSRKRSYRSTAPRRERPNELFFPRSSSSNCSSERHGIVNLSLVSSTSPPCFINDAGAALCLPAE